MKTKIAFVLVLLFVSGFSDKVFSQEYPSKAITLVVGNDVGSFLDVTSRVLGDEMKKVLGQDVLVENKVGASHMVALSYTLSQKPDGYTLFSSPEAPFTRGPHLLKLKFDPIKETVPIIFYTKFTHFLVVPADSKFKNLRDMLAFAKENPEKLTIGNPGYGTVPYITMAGVESETGLKFSHVPFAGEPKEIAALLGGHLMTAGIAVEACIAQIKSGQLRALAVLQGDERLSAFPDIPTLKEIAKEFGMKSSVIYPGLMLSGPRGLPESVVKTVASSVDKARQSPAFLKFCQEHYLFQDGMPITGQALRDYIAKGHKDTGDLIQKLGLQKK